MIEFFESFEKSEKEGRKENMAEQLNKLGFIEVNPSANISPSNPILSFEFEGVRYEIYPYIVDMLNMLRSGQQIAGFRGLIETNEKNIVVVLLIEGVNETEDSFNVRVFVRNFPDNKSEQEKLDDFLSTKNGIYSINMNYKID